MTLYLHLLRHAKATTSDDLDDHDRPLAPKGERGCQLLAAEIRRQGWSFDRVLCSTTTRTTQTWHLIQQKLGDEARVDYTRRLYLCSAQSMIATIADMAGDAHRLLVVGHNPTTQEAIRLLTGSAEPGLLEDVAFKVPTGALASLSFEIDSWTQLAPGRGHLFNFMVPKGLERAEG